ncbi:hypothetical protein Pla110_09090 [Polystyrenella longa]|uniref:Sulfatase n=1 Tax=Polystyrenella longa TaxID=2528007 RepID=A0A518CJ31_9PLAN|nr:DUF1501 domain-containing protein [Polystyrenella longa]QDU79204.1 hypothetical protein Pla110_09090 [Polystyrenella longa]
MWNINRRRCLQTLAGSIAGASASPWLRPLAQAMAAEKTGSPKRNLIVLWMTGGPSQLDTFDLKPEHENGGEFKPIDTNVPGIQISEHLPQLAQQADKLAIIRSLSTKEGDHARGTYLMHTGQRPGAPINYPSICASLSKELRGSDDTLPNFMSVGGQLINFGMEIGPGFLGPGFAPLSVRAQAIPSQGGGTPTDASAESNPNNENAAMAYPSFRVEDLALGGSLDADQHQKRTELWSRLQTDFANRQGTSSALASHQTVYQRAMNMMNGPAGKLFDLSDEPEELRQAYGTGVFGQSCLLARRLIEAGVSVIEVPFDGVSWDTHADNFTAVKNLSGELDSAWSTLMTDLDQRGLLETTTILWMGEFGRTPNINGNSGRDHFAQAWSCVFAGGGINGGQVYGATNESGMEVTNQKVEVGDVLTTLCDAVDIPSYTQNMSNLGRPINIAEGTAIVDVLS